MRFFWRHVRHRPYVALGTSKCFRCGYHYSPMHPGGRG